MNATVAFNEIPEPLVLHDSTDWGKHYMYLLLWFQPHKAAHSPARVMLWPAFKIDKCFMAVN